MYLSIIIPAFNEQDRISATLHDIRDYLEGKQYKYEVLVVNDGSTDRTSEVVKTVLPHMANLRIIDNETNHGKGKVVRQGMLSANGRWRLFMDADNSTNVQSLEKLLPFGEQGYDVVVGSRRVSGAKIKVKQNWLRDLLGGVFRMLVALIVPVGVKDTQNGFKLFSARAAEEIFRKQRMMTWAFDVEILAIAKKLSYKIKEVPIDWTNDGRSHVTAGGMIRMLWEVIHIRLNLWSNVYNKDGLVKEVVVSQVDL